MRESERLELIREIEAKRGSRLISYITSDRPGYSGSVMPRDVRVIERHLRDIASLKLKRIDLFLNTPGGYTVVPWSLVLLFREFLKHRPFDVLIESRAFSAGTMIALGADEVVMGPAGNIGPIDSRHDSIPIEDVRGYFDFAEDLGLSKPADRLRIFTLMAEAVHPIRVGDIYRGWAENERLAMMLLQSRRKPLPDKINRQITSFLMRGIANHGQPIRRTEARANGINFIKDSEECSIDREMTALFDAYEDLLHLDMPFLRERAHHPDSEEEIEYGDLSPIALVESVDRLDVARVAHGTRFWRAPEEPAETGPAPIEVGSKGHAELSVQWEEVRIPQARKPSLRRA